MTDSHDDSETDTTNDRGIDTKNDPTDTDGRDTADADPRTDGTDDSTEGPRWSEEARRIAPETLQRAVCCIDPAWTVTGATPAEAGHQIVYLLTMDTPGGELDPVLKATAPGSIAAAGSEARFLAWLDAATGVPVPTVYGVLDADAPAQVTDGLPTPLFLMERLDGKPIRRREIADLPVSRVKRVARATGAALAALHTLSPDGFGFLTCEVTAPLAGGRPPAEPNLAIDGADDWPTFYRRTVRETLAALAESRFADVAPDARPAVERDIERLAAGGPYRPVVAHIDGTPDNLLFDGDDLVGMLDWEFTMATPPAYDIVCMSRGLAGGHWRFLPEVPDRLETVQAALLAGYRDAATSAPKTGDAAMGAVVEGVADRVAERLRAHGDAYHLLAALRSMHLFADVFDRFGVAGDRREAAARALRAAVRRRLDSRSE